MTRPNINNPRRPTESFCIRPEVVSYNTKLLISARQDRTNPDLGRRKVEFGTIAFLRNSADLYIP